MLVTSALGYAAQLGLAFAAAGTMLGARAVGAADTAAYGQLAVRLVCLAGAVGVAAALVYALGGALLLRTAPSLPYMPLLCPSCEPSLARGALLRDVGTLVHIYL